MAAGEILITCPACQHRASLPIAAVRRNNYYCARCFEKVPMDQVRTGGGDNDGRTPPRKVPKRNRH